MTVVERRRQVPTDSQEVDAASPATDQALFEEARRLTLRRRIRIALVTVFVVIAACATLAVAGGFDGTATHGLRTPAANNVRPALPPADSSTPTASPGMIGEGPTSFDFIDPRHGWIATGCSNYCFDAGPVIVRTDDAGRTWQRVHGPDVSAAAVAGSVWYQYGGVVNVRFHGTMEGWYLQAGALWSTVDGGATWQMDHLNGVVKTITTSDDGVWALVDSCPGGVLLDCPSFHVYFRAFSGPTWQRFPRTFSPGSGVDSGSGLVAEGAAVFVSVPGRMFKVAPNGSVAAVDARCQPVGALTQGRIVGLCNLGPGMFGISSDEGRHWGHFVGLPSHQYASAVTSNGSRALFYVAFGTTMWRLDVASRAWIAVLPSSTTAVNAFYAPLYFADANSGYVLESDSSGTHVLATHDAGMTWNTVPLP